MPTERKTPEDIDTIENGAVHALASGQWPKSADRVVRDLLALVRELREERDNIDKLGTKYVKAFDDRTLEWFNVCLERDRLRAENAELREERDAAREQALADRAFQSEAQRLRAENAEQASVLGELEQDKARLDWLEQNVSFVEGSPSRRQWAAKKPLREAIDAALRQTEETSE